MIDIDHRRILEDLRAGSNRRPGQPQAIVERIKMPGATLPQGTVIDGRPNARLKLGRPAMAARDRAHFLAIAARAMRQVLVDHARDRKAAKRGGGEWERTTLTDGAWAGEFDPDGVLALDEALGRLDPRQRQVVECRFFGGMEEQEIAAALGISERTVHRDWLKARAWLYRYFYPEGDGPSGDRPSGDEPASA